MAGEIVFSIKAEGLREAQRDFATYRDHTRQQIVDLLDAYALLIQAQAQINAPVDTGFLRSSIIVLSPEPLTRIIAATASYSIFVEFGTRRTRAQPFLVPAAMQYKRDFEQALREVLRG